MKDFAKLAATLTEQLKGRVPTNKKVTWNNNMLKAFEALNSALLENVTLDIADPCKPFTLEVDASDYAVGGVLSQRPRRRPATCRILQQKA